MTVAIRKGHYVPLTGTIAAPFAPPEVGFVIILEATKVPYLKSFDFVVLDSPSPHQKE